MSKRDALLGASQGDGNTGFGCNRHEICILMLEINKYIAEIFKNAKPPQCTGNLDTIRKTCFDLDIFGRGNEVPCALYIGRERGRLLRYICQTKEC